MDSYGRHQAGGGFMKCWMCVSNQVASYIITAITLVLVIAGLAYGAAMLDKEIKLYKSFNQPVPNGIVAAYAIMIVKNVLMIVPTLVLGAGIYKAISNWFYPALLGYIFYFILTIADAAVLFASSVGFYGGQVAYVVLSLLLSIYFFIVVNYHKKEVVQGESRVGVQTFNPRVRY